MKSMLTTAVVLIGTALSGCGGSATHKAPPVIDLQAKLAAASKSAKQPPDCEDDTASRATRFPFVAGKQREVITQPLRLTTLRLERGERVNHIGGGDTARWLVQPSHTGTGACKQQVVMIKPKAPDIRTNLVITTNRRIYHVALSSRSGGHMAEVIWDYSAKAPASPPPAPARETRPSTSLVADAVVPAQAPPAPTYSAPVAPSPSFPPVTYQPTPVPSHWIQSPRGRWYYNPHPRRWPPRYVRSTGYYPGPAIRYYRQVAPGLHVMPDPRAFRRQRMWYR